ncbi:MAG: hypothetical protein NTZ78_04170 [Candidatus Aureabacteria bacterium]|nr:hypothetical protein [Candidatus Auribacterota bacterium]
MKPIKEMKNSELAAFIETHLRERGIDVVLSGGACVSIYSNGKFVSMDLNLIDIYLEKRSKIRKAMQELGFNEEGRHFIHPDTDFYVEFPPGPLSVGEEPVKKVDEHKLATGILRIISPTDCVKDRLAAYYHWDDAQCLEQAILVTQAKKIDLKEIERWSKVERNLKGFKRFKNRLK